MKPIISLFLNVDRTYIAVLEPGPKGLSLLYLESTKNPINLELMDEDDMIVAASEISEIIPNFGLDYQTINITLPAESVMMSQIPGKTGISNEQLKQLIALEIRQSYPHFSFTDFTPRVIPFDPKKTGKHTMMAVIYSKNDLKLCNELIKPLNRQMDNIEISQFAAHTAFLYNYPEKANKTVVLLSIQSQFMDISLIENKKPIYYHLVSLQGTKNIGQVVEDELPKLLAEQVDKIDAVYLFGSGLTKENFMSAWESAMAMDIEAGRLNAFRMVSTNMTPREREYCTRVGHIVAPCIGGALKQYHNIIRLN
ncbi:MAG: hypothetical protein HW421_615 [Ignavibacteria bacterium]|nr:hypothetical protein [Ignavibacteria bacterium]